MKNLVMAELEEFQKLSNLELPIYALDVNSKFETAPGKKNIEELKKFKKELTI
jgi:phosphoribosylanthranilate isomerase